MTARFQRRRWDPKCDIQFGFVYYECLECEFDAVLTDIPRQMKPICPLCASDNGRDVPMRSRPARKDDVTVEGTDMRRFGGEKL